MCAKAVGSVTDHANVPPYRALLGRNVKELRALRGIRQEELAAQIGMSRAYLSSIERGQKAATIDTIAKIAEGLGVPIIRLLEDDPKAEKGRQAGKSHR